MRDSSVFSFFGEPCSLIFRPREHVPRWRRWCGHCLWRPCWGRVFLDQRGELRSRARPCASIGGGHRFTDANGGGLDAVRDAGIADYPPDIAVRKATRLRSQIVPRESNAERTPRVKSGAHAVIAAREHHSGRGDVPARQEKLVPG